jgi:hypothetical protein
MGVLICLYWVQNLIPSVMVTVSKLVGAIGELGQLMLPCISYHLIYVIFQALVISRAKSKGGL